MALIVKDNSEGAQFELPEAGLVRAVCVDTYDSGIKESPWGEKPTVMIVWEIDETHPKFNSPFRVNRRYTASLNEKANLCQDLESWRGKSFTEAERRGFDLETIIGKPCMLNIVHNESNGRTYANVKAVLPMKKGDDPLKPSGEYVRVIDRAGGDGANEDMDNFAVKQQEDHLPF